MDTATVLKEAHRINSMVVNRAKEKFLIYEYLPIGEKLPDSPAIRYETDRVLVDLGKSNNLYMPMSPVILNHSELKMNNSEWKRHLKALKNDFDQLKKLSNYRMTCGFGLKHFFNGHTAMAHQIGQDDVDPIVPYCHTSQWGKFSYTVEENKKEIILRMTVQNTQYVKPHMTELTKYLHEYLVDKFHIIKPLRIEL